MCIRDSYKGAERLAVRQRIKTIAFTVLVLLGAAWGGKRAWDRRVFQRLGGSAVHLLNAVADAGVAAKDRVLALVPK